MRVDLPEAQEVKKRHLIRIFTSLPGHVVFVPLDLNSQSFEQDLTMPWPGHEQADSFHPEGVPQYLRPVAVAEILKYIGQAARGNKLVLTYLLMIVVEGSSTLPGADTLKKRLPLLFGIDPDDINRYLRKYNLTLIEDVGTDIYEERYLKPTGRRLEVSRVERCAQARVSQQ